jgi:hypothetical protein
MITAAYTVHIFHVVVGDLTCIDIAKPTTAGARIGKRVKHIDERFWLV